MTRIRSVTLGLIAVLAVTGAAMAQMQPQPAPRTSGQGAAALEQAWHQCLQWVDRTAPRTGENDSQRTAQFKACMAERGYTR